jgi:hypothetical protein
MEILFPPDTFPFKFALCKHFFLGPCGYFDHMVIYCTSSSNKCSFIFHKKPFLLHCATVITITLNAESLNMNKISEDIFRKRFTKGFSQRMSFS